VQHFGIQVKKKKGKKKKKEYDPPVYQIPTYDDPEVVTPRVDLVIRNGAVNIPDDVMTMRVNMMITATVAAVAKEISKFHQGAISNIIICKDHFEPTEALNSAATL